MSAIRILGGVPDGGQYAASPRAEAQIELDERSSPEPVDRESLIARRDALTQLASQLQEEADVVEMRLLAGDIEREFPGMTHLAIRAPHGKPATQVVFTQNDPLYPRHINMQSQTDGNFDPASENTVADRLLRLHNRTGSPLNKLTVGADRYSGVPIADLGSAERPGDEVDAERESVLGDVHHWIEPLIGSARRDAAAGRPYNHHDVDNRIGQLTDSLLSRIELDRMPRPSFDLEPDRSAESAAPVVPLANPRKKPS